MGIREIQVTKNNVNSFSFRLIGEQKNINGQIFNPNKKEITVFKNADSEIIILLSNSKNHLIIHENTLKLSIDNKIFDFNNSNLDKLSPKDETEFIEILAISDEIFNANLQRKSYIDSNEFLKSEECAFSSMSARSSRSYSEIRAKRAADEFIDDHEDCELVGEVDSGCLWDDLVCIATQTIECNGETCD